MKTRAEILQSIQQWYGMGAEMASIKEDKAAKSIMMRPGMWTNHSQAAICGDNPYTIVCSCEGVYPTPRYGLLVMIYYEA